VRTRALRSSLGVLALLVGATTQAQSTWTGNGANNNWNTAANWTPAGPPAAGANVTFTKASTPTMNVAATVGSLTKSGGGALTISGPSTLTINGGLTRTGGAINLNGNVVLGAAQTWSISGGTTTVSGVLSGAALTRSGAGNLVLAAANTFSSLTVSSGTVRATASHSLGSGAVTLAGGTLTLNSATALVLPNTVTATGTATLNVDSSASAQHVLTSLTTNTGVTLMLAGNNQTTLEVTTLTTNGTLSTTTASPGVYVVGVLSATAPLIIRGAPANPTAAQLALGLHLVTTTPAAAPIVGTGGAAANSTILGADGAVNAVFSGSATVVNGTSNTGRLVLTPRTGATLTIGAGAQILSSVGNTGNPLQLRGDGTGTVSFAAGFNSLAGANGLDNVSLFGGGVWQTNANGNLPNSVTVSTTGSTWRTATNAQTFAGAVAVNAATTIDTEASLALTGVLSGGGGNLLTKIGSGTLTLANAANTHTGGLTVNAGTLNVTGKLAAGEATTVNSGGVIAGTGQTGALTVASGGNYTPGVGGSGTLTTTGNVVLNTSSNLNFTVGTAHTSGTISGNLTLAGVFNITAGTGLAPGSFTLFTVGGHITNNSPTFGPFPSGFNIGYRIVGTQVILDVVTRPLSVRMVSLSGTHDGVSSQISWRAGQEIRTLGYRVWRDSGGARALVTNRLIAGSALRASADLANGHQYTVSDSGAPNGGTYWIEALSLDGQSELLGPVSTRPGTLTATPPSTTLADIASPTRTLAAGARSTTLPPLANPFTTPFGAQQALLANQPAAKVGVQASGFYRVPAEALFAAGIPKGAPVSSLQVWCLADPVAFLVSSADGVHLNPGDTLEFFGQGADTRYTDTLVYWVTSGLGNAVLIPSLSAAGAGDAGRSFPETLELQEHTVYFGGLKNGGQEKFFGPPVFSTPLVQTFSTPAVDLASTQAAQLRVQLQGVTSAGHLVDVSVNGVNVGSMSWTGEIEMVSTFSLPYALLVAGDNQVLLVTRSADTDVSLEVSVQLTYPRLYKGLGQPLMFTAPGGSVVRLSGFSGTSAHVLDVTNAVSPVAVHWTTNNTDPSALNVSVPGTGSHTLYAFADADAQAPASVLTNVPSSWHSSPGAQLVIIGDASLLPAIQPLTAQRQSEGLRVATIDVQDVYDEFSGGEKDAYAIRAFLLYALENWATPPKYVLLVGNASFNPRNYPGFGTGMDLVPALFVETSFEEVGSDDEFVKPQGSYSPLMAIGRLPFAQAADVQSSVSKMLGRKLATRDAALLFVHDIDESANSFSNYTNSVIGALPGWTSSVLVRDPPALAAESQSDIDASLHVQLLSALSTGPPVVTYLGHGEEPYWANPAVFSIADQAALTTMGQPAVYFAGTCRNGWFTDIGDSGADILGASLLRADGGGAWAVWAADGDAPSNDLPTLASGVLRGTLIDGLTLGDATVRAKETVLDPDLRAVFHLLGDPSARIVPPQNSSTLAFPTTVTSSATTGCGTPGNTALAVLPLIATAFLLAQRKGRRRRGKNELEVSLLTGSGVGSAPSSPVGGTPAQGC